jgi:putative zinc finger/helix-turn-helix YgiT family protein
MEQKKITKGTTFRGVDINYKENVFVCPECGLKAGTIKTAGAIQKEIADAYRVKVGLLTGDKIKSLRTSRGRTQQQLAEYMNIGVASVKRWETGLIQSKAMDRALRVHLQGYNATNTYSGNREFSIPRIKLVIRTFEKKLRKKLLKKTDKLLFAAKYLWYADMLAFKFLGKSMTGAAYAALPYGPQLNNYVDLIDEIKNSDESSAEPLSNDETRIIEKITEAFPVERMVYDAAHREAVWKKTPIGATIPYSSSEEITGL